MDEENRLMTACFPVLMDSLRAAIDMSAQDAVSYLSAAIMPICIEHGKPEDAPIIAKSFMVCVHERLAKMAAEKIISILMGVAGAVEGKADAPAPLKPMDKPDWKAVSSAIPDGIPKGFF